ncbi:MAG: AMP-binding protein [Acidimicrobiales bacterium]
MIADMSARADGRDFIDDVNARTGARGWLGAPTLWELIERRAKATPGALMAIDENGRSLTFGEYRNRCVSAAAGLHDQYGVSEGTAVSWELPTWLESLVLVGALARLSARQNPIIPIYREREVGFVVKQTGAKLLVVPSTWRGFDYEAMANTIAEAIADDAGDAGREDRMKVLVADHSLPEGDPANLPPPPTIPAEASDAPVRWVFYTSGTTADPKGAQHTDLSVLASALAMSECLDLSAEDVSGLVFPFTHIGGIGWLMAVLIAGCEVVITEAFDASATPALLAANDVTLAGSGTPFHMAYLQAQRSDPGNKLFPKVRAFPGGGAPKPPQLHHDIKNEVGGIGIVSGYGLTEAPIVFMATCSDPDHKLAQTEGQARPGVIFKVVSLDGSPAPAGVEGELRVQGPQLMRGYLDSSLDSDAFDEEGFFKSGDLAVVDEDGYVVITGRLKDVIIRHGENISAKEVEDLVYQHPSVADVAVIGLPDSRTGERACAVVSLRAGAEPLDLEGLKDFLIGKGLRTQAVPEQLEIVATVPRNPAGKILKHKLREQFTNA